MIRIVFTLVLLIPIAALHAQTARTCASEKMDELVAKQEQAAQPSLENSQKLLAAIVAKADCDKYVVDSNSKAQQKTQENSEKVINVFIQVPELIFSNGVISGLTNLPDGSILSVGIYGRPYSQFNRDYPANQVKVSVYNRKFGPIKIVGENAVIPPDKYTLSIIMPYNIIEGDQPDEVTKIIGQYGKNLRGPFVKYNPDFPPNGIRNIEAKFFLIVQ